MKKLIFILSVIMLTAFAQTAKVYVCVSSSSVAYHANRNCSGLARCTHEIKAVSEEEAQGLGKRPCKICFKKQ